MVNLLWKDILILKRFLWLAPLYGFFALFVFRSMPGGALGAGTVGVTYMLMSQAITLDDKNKSDVMLNSLPLRRKDIVLAKYLSVFLCCPRDPVFPSSPDSGDCHPDSYLYNQAHFNRYFRGFDHCSCVDFSLFSDIF